MSDFGDHLLLQGPASATPGSLKAERSGPESNGSVAEKSRRPSLLPFAQEHCDWRTQGSAVCVCFPESLMAFLPLFVLRLPLSPPPCLTPCTPPLGPGFVFAVVSPRDAVCACPTLRPGPCMPAAQRSSRAALRFSPGLGTPQERALQSSLSGKACVLHSHGG